MHFQLEGFFSILFETTDDRSRKNPISEIDETISTYGSNLKAVGHFEPYQTHWLYPSDQVNQTEQITSDDRLITALNASDSWRLDAPGSEIPFQKLILKRSTKSAGRNPYLIVKVDKKLIPDHSKIDDPRIHSFLSEMVLISTTPEQQKYELRKKLIK